MWRVVLSIALLSAPLLSGCGERMSDWERAAVRWEAEAQKAERKAERRGNTAELERARSEVSRRSALLLEWRQAREAYRAARTEAQETDAAERDYAERLRSTQGWAAYSGLRGGTPAMDRWYEILQGRAVLAKGAAKRAADRQREAAIAVSDAMGWEPEPQGSADVRVWLEKIQAQNAEVENE